MKEFGLDDLRVLMKSCAGVAEDMDLDGDILRVPFEQLGYDSLALLEIAHKIEDQLGVVIPDETVEKMLTPLEVIDYVNVTVLKAG
jgi:minimal PKS acyl carrier protein